MFGMPSGRSASRNIDVMNVPWTRSWILSAGPVMKRQRSGSAWYRLAYSASRAGVSYVGSTEIDSSLMCVPASNVLSWIRPIFIDVTGQIVSQRVKMKLTIVGWPRSAASVNGWPRSSVSWNGVTTPMSPMSGA